MEQAHTSPNRHASHPRRDSVLNLLLTALFLLLGGTAAPLLRRLQTIIIAYRTGTLVLPKPRRPRAAPQPDAEARETGVTLIVCIVVPKRRPIPESRSLPPRIERPPRSPKTRFFRIIPARPFYSDCVTTT